MADECDSLLRIIRCHAPIEVLEERVRSRDHPRDKGKLASFQQYHASHYPMFDIPLLHLDLDTTRDNVQKVLAYIETGILS